jgi:hypothetical protein
MTRKQYRTAMGKVVDMGALMLQNESVRAVGNMHVNAKGDKLNSTNNVIDKKSHQIKRQTKKQTNVSSAPPAKPGNPQVTEMFVDPLDTFTDLPDDNDVTTNEASALQGGLAAAIAKAKTIQQTKLIPPKQAAKSAGVKKI